MADADLHAARSQYCADVAAPRDDPPQREHRRVGREQHELAAGRRQLQAAVERLLQIGHDLDPVAIEAAVGEAQRQLGGPRAGRDDTLEPAEERLEVDVPDPRDVAAVGDLVVQRDHRERRRASPSSSVRTASFAPGRVLDQQHQQPPVADRDPLEAAERGDEALEPAAISATGTSSASRERRRGDAL